MNDFSPPPLFDYPKQAKFGRIIAKNKIYERIKLNRKQQDAFISHVKKIIWQYKLAPTTINLSETENVKEIEVLEVVSKTKNLDIKVLQSIDKAIAHPIIFHVVVDDNIKVMACYKRPSEAEASKWVMSGDYFESDWLPIKTERQKLPVVLNLSNLYEHILRTLIPLPSRENESLENHIERARQVSALKKDLQILEARMNNAQQYNRRVEMNAELRKRQDNIKKLTER